MPFTNLEHLRPSWDSSSLASRPWAGWGSQSVVGVGGGQCLFGVCRNRRYVALVTLIMQDTPFPQEFYFRNALRSASTTAPCDLAEPATPWPGGERLLWAEDASWLVGRHGWEQSLWLWESRLNLAKAATVYTLKRITTHRLKRIQYIEIYALIMIFLNLFVTFECMKDSPYHLINKGKDPIDHFLNELYSGNQMKNCSKI